MKLIANRKGLEVWRTSQGILKLATHDRNRRGLVNEGRMLRLMEGSGFAPALLSERPGMLLQEDVGPTLQQGAIVTEPSRFRRNCTFLLQALRNRGIRHGDLTTTNLALRKGDVPVALDWQESRLFEEAGEDKQPHSDCYLLWQRLAETGLDGDRVMRRWMAVVADLGGDVGVASLEDLRLLDLGCFEGDFCGLASADGMLAIGVDRDWGAIQRARTTWLASNATFVAHDIRGLPLDQLRADAVLLFSTWAYVVREHGREDAERLIATVLAQEGPHFETRLYFETQLAGDGPGPDFLATDEDVGEYLAQFGKTVRLVTIPVTGREAQRTVWRVTR